MRNLEFKEETVADCWDEFPELGRLHREEVRGADDDSWPSQDWYIARNEDEDLKLFTARSNGVLVGYCVMMMGGDVKRSEELCATQDVLFLHADHRAGLAGVRFIKYVENQMAEAGVGWLYQSATPGNNFGKILERIGYSQSTITYAKNLQGE